MNKKKKSECCEDEIKVEVRDYVPEGEIWFCYGPRIVGKIVNIWEKKNEIRNKTR